jgi:DNA polymerase-3 subunit beta
MKFGANSIELQRALSKVGGVVPTRSTMPILESLLFELVNDTLTVTATDMEISLSVSVQVKGSEDGKIAIPAKRMTDTIRALPDTGVSFHIDTVSNKVRIVTDNGEYVLTGESAKDFPSVAEFKGNHQEKLESEALKKIIHRTLFAVSTDELRPAMMGVLLQAVGDEFKAVSTDGHRLVKLVNNMGRSVGLKKDIIVPAKALSLVGRSIESGTIGISVDDTHIMFSFDKTVLISRLIDEIYPNYESVIPRDNDKTMTVKREQMLSSLRRVALYASASTHQVRFEIKKESLTISAQDIDFGGEARETMPCTYTGGELEIGFNSTYMADILSHLESEEVSFAFSTPTRAGIVKPVGPQDTEQVTMLVMPVRLSN